MSYTKRDIEFIEKHVSLWILFSCMTIHIILVFGGGGGYRKVFASCTPSPYRGAEGVQERTKQLLELTKVSSKSKTKTLQKGNKANTEDIEDELVEWILMN